MPVDDYVLYDANNGGIQSGVTFELWNYSYNEWSHSEWFVFKNPSHTMSMNHLGTITETMDSVMLIPDYIDITDYRKICVEVSSIEGDSFYGGGNVYIDSTYETPTHFGGGLNVGINKFNIADCINEGTDSVRLYPADVNIPSMGTSNTCTTIISKVWLSNEEDPPPSTRCSFELKTPIRPKNVNESISSCNISVIGQFPNDSTLSVQVTNNAFDISPVWEELTSSEKAGGTHIFTNITAIEGFAFSFKVDAEEGVSGEKGYITKVQGSFR